MYIRRAEWSQFLLLRRRRRRHRQLFGTTLTDGVRRGGIKNEYTKDKNMSSIRRDKIYMIQIIAKLYIILGV